MVSAAGTPLKGQIKGSGRPPTHTNYGHEHVSSKVGIRKSVFKIQNMLQHEKKANARLHDEIMKVKEAFETFSHVSSKKGLL